MVELASTKVKNAVHEMMEDLDKNCMREMLGKMHKCAAKCCENSSTSMEETHLCIENCNKPISEARAFIDQEITFFQDRLQRCVLQCQDTIRDKITPSSTEEEVGTLKKDFEKCFLKCADSHIDLIPPMLKRIKMHLKQL